MRTVPFTPTHHNYTSHTWIDHILISKYCEIISHSQCATLSSAHDLVEVNVRIRHRKPEARPFVYRDLTNLDRSAYLVDLADSRWDDFYNLESIDFKVNYLTQALLSTLDRHAPRKRAIVRKRPAPWLSDDVKAVMRRRAMVRSKFRRTGDLNFKPEFIQLHNEE